MGIAIHWGQADGLYGAGWLCTLALVGTDLQQGNIIVVSKAVSTVVLMQDELFHLKFHLPMSAGVKGLPTQVDNVVFLMLVIDEAVGGADHPAGTDEAATTHIGDRASTMPSIDGCKPRLVLDGGAFSPNNLKAGPQSLLATLKLYFFRSREGIFSIISRPVTLTTRAVGHHALLDKLLQANLHVAPGSSLIVWVPAVIVFPQAQLQGVRSVGMVRVQKDSGRVPGQAGPASSVGIGLPSVRVTVPLKAGLRCVYLTVLPLEFLWAAASLNVGEVLVGHTFSSIQTATVRCTRLLMKFMAAFGVAHDQDTEEQARPQDSHAGEAWALDSGSSTMACMGQRGLVGTLITPPKITKT